MLAISETNLQGSCTHAVLVLNSCGFGSGEALAATGGPVVQ